MADDHDIIVALGQHASPQDRVGMAIDDGLDRFVAYSTDGRQQQFTVMLAVAGIKGNQPFVRVDHGDRGETIAAKVPDTIGRGVNRRLGPGNFIDPIQNLLVGNCAVSPAYSPNASAGVLPVSFGAL